MDYATLCTAVTDTCEDNFSADDLARFAKQAEQKIYSSAQLPSLRKSAAPTVTLGDKYVSMPDDFLSVFSLAVVIPVTGAYQYLIEKDVNFLREAYPVPTTTGVPKHYALFGPQTGDANELRLIVGPTPAAAYVTELHYNAYPESIVTASDTWLSENFDSVLFNGMMVEAHRFMKSEKDQIDLQEALFKESLALLKNLGDGKQKTDTYRTPAPRVKPL